jgi:acetyltransferase-like isoleucine patch superfamily enzyme
MNLYILDDLSLYSSNCRVFLPDVVDNTYIYKDITIEDQVWLGSRVIVLGGVTIGEGAIIQAGSVVVKDIPKYAIAGGHPCKVFSQRDIEHYEKLKLEGLFH